MSIKDEMIKNEIHRLHLYQLNISIKKTNKSMRTLKVKSLRSSSFAINDPDHYEIDSYNPVKYSHILSMVLYTDWTELRCKFAGAFRHFVENIDLNHYHLLNNEISNFIGGQEI